MRHRHYQLAVVTALLAGLLVLPARADDATGFVQVAEWKGAAVTSTTVLPMIAVDAPARTGFVLTGGSQEVDARSEQSWNRVQAIDLDTGQPRSARVDIPRLETRAPVLVDTRRHLLIYAAMTAPADAVKAYAGPPAIVGLRLTHGAPTVLFTVRSPLPTGRIAGMALTADGSGLVIAGTNSPGDTVQAVLSSATISLDWLSVDALLDGKASSHWGLPYSLPAGQCPELIQVAQPVGVLVSSAGVSVPCRSVTSLPTKYASAGQPSGVFTLRGATAMAPGNAAELAPAPGNFGEQGESYADPVTGRMVLIDQSVGGSGARVFDALHGRYVGMIKAGQGSPSGVTGDPLTGRVYFSGVNPGADIGAFDLAPIVPTQGYLDTTHFGGAIGNTVDLRMTVDTVAHHLLVPRGDPRNGGDSVLVIADHVPVVTPKPAANPDAGALDAPELPGVTDSSRSAIVHAYGADYQVIGGTENLVQNLSGADSGGTFRPGTRSLRQAYVKEATLGNEESSATAVTAEEDRATDADRNGVKPQTQGQVDAGNKFAPAAGCSDFGSSPTTAPVAAFTAQVSCNSHQQQTGAAVSFEALNGVFLTTQGHNAPVAAPVQVGSSSVDVAETRAAARGAARAVVTARAESISILGRIHIGRVVSTVTVSAHGRSGTAMVSRPTLAVSGVSVDGTPVCSVTCSVSQVTAAVNTALAGHGHVDFPAGQLVQTPGGTLASFGQDPWYHAERVLDYDKSDDDFAVPAMTIGINLEGRAKSRLVVDLAGLDAASLYRIYALSQVGPVHVPPVEVPTVFPTVQIPRTVVPVTPHGDVPAPVSAPDYSGTGPITALVRSLSFGLRSPGAALPVLLVWALLACGPYLAARRRLLLELPLLSREQDIA